MKYTIYLYDSVQMEMSLSVDEERIISSREKMEKYKADYFRGNVHADKER